MWTIDKSFNFEMGHRVWAQKLPHAHLSIDTACACKHLHGHSYKIKVFLSGEKLDQSGMVTDFKNLNFVKKFVDEKLDHKFMIDINDPHFDIITGISSAYFHEFKQFSNLGEIVCHKDEEISSHLHSFVLVNFCPTSENICKHLFEYLKDEIKDVANLVAVELWETEKSHCRYEENV